jgi:hypothetical protein
LKLSEKVEELKKYKEFEVRMMATNQMKEK